MMKNKKLIFSAVTILAFLLQLIFLYYIKYKNQNMHLGEFSLSSTGNILNLFFTVLIISAIIIGYFQRTNRLTNRVLIVFIILLSLLLILAVISTQVNFFSNNLSSFRRPAAQLFTGAIFTLYQVVLIYFGMVLWLGIFGRYDLIYIRAFVNTIIIVGVLFIFSFFYLQSSKMSNDFGKKNNTRSDVAVVLGAAVWTDRPSPSLAARVDKAVKLYNEGVVNIIQLTGSNAPGEMSEAQVAYKYLLTKNISDPDVWIEDRTTSTNEQIFYIKNSLMVKENIGIIIIVSDAYHLKRVKEICNFYHLNVEVASSDLEIGFEDLFYHKLKETIAILVFWFFAL
ncbi:MAG: YdcF family protein [Ignavibacteriales bacterium]|nr:MAG: YdcF family protein [Ignavibacteriales bacterium]